MGLFALYSASSENFSAKKEKRVSVPLFQISLFVSGHLSFWVRQAETPGLGYEKILWVIHGLYA